MADYLRNDEVLDGSDRLLRCDEISWIDSTRLELIDVIEPRNLLTFSSGISAYQKEHNDGIKAQTSKTEMNRILVDVVT